MKRIDSIAKKTQVYVSDTGKVVMKQLGYDGKWRVFSVSSEAGVRVYETPFQKVSYVNGNDVAVEVAAATEPLAERTARRHVRSLLTNTPVMSLN